MTKGVARLRACADARFVRENILCYSELFVNVKYVLLVSIPHLRRYSPNVITAWCVI